MAGGEEVKKSATRLAAEAALQAENDAAATKKKAASAISATKQASIAALESGNSLSGTSIEETPGFFNQLGHAVKRGAKAVFGDELPSAGDMDPKLGQAADLAGFGIPGMLAAAPTGLLGMLDTLANRDARLGEVAHATTAATSVADTLSFGALNKVGAAVDTAFGNAPRGATDLETLSALWQRETGGDMATYAEQLDARALGQEEIRAANPLTALGGDVLASVTTGAGVAKLAYSTLAKGSSKLAASLFSTVPRRILAGSTLGGAEAFTYSMNKHGDLKRAAVDGSLSALGGLVLGGGLSVGWSGLNRAFGARAHDVAEEAVGDAFLANINVDNKIAGRPGNATAASVVADLAKLGPDATLMDAYPSLRKFANMFVAQDATKKNAVPLYDLLSKRASFLTDMLSPDGTLRSAFGAQVVRSADTFATAAKERFKKLQPKYAAIYADNRDLTLSAKQIYDNISATLGPAARRTAGQIQLAKDLAAQIKVFQKQATRSKGGGLPDDLTLEQAVNLKQWLQDSVGAKASTVTNTTKTKPLTNAAVRDYTNAAIYIQELLDKAVPDMAPLNAVYGNIASLRTAYKAGTQAFSSAAKDSADVAAFMAGDASAAGKRAFIEGAKYHLFTKLGSAGTVEGVQKVLDDNKPMINKLKAMFGEQAAQEMIDAAKAMAVKTKTATDMKKVVQSVSNAEILTPESGVKSALDAGIALAGVPGFTSKAGALGALGRLTSGAPNEAAVGHASQYGSDILTRMGEGASDAFKELQRMTERTALASKGHQAILPAGVGAASGAVRSQKRNSDGQLPQ